MAKEGFSPSAPCWLYHGGQILLGPILLNFAMGQFNGHASGAEFPRLASPLVRIKLSSKYTTAASLFLYRH